MLVHFRSRLHVDRAVTERRDRTLFWLQSACQSTVKQTTTGRQEASVYLHQCPCPVTLALAQQHSCKVGGPRLLPPPPSSSSSLPATAAESLNTISISFHQIHLQKNWTDMSPFFSAARLLHENLLSPLHCYLIELGNRSWFVFTEEGGRLLLAACIDRAEKHSWWWEEMRAFRLSLAPLNAAANVWEGRECQSFKTVHTHTIHSSIMDALECLIRSRKKMWLTCIM